MCYAQHEVIMSMPISICLLIFRTIAIISCAPKIGRQPLAPLTFETNNLDDKDALYKIQYRRKYIAANGNNTQQETKAPCISYDYDSTKCKSVNNRILCGYNKNVGEQKTNDEMTDIGNGCRLRGERIECGYVLKPFTNIRRPPAHDPESHKENRESDVNHTINSFRSISVNTVTILLTKLTNATTTTKKVELSTATKSKVESSTSTKNKLESSASTITSILLPTSKKAKKLTNKMLPTIISTLAAYITNTTGLPEYNSTKTTTNRATYKSSKKWNSNCVEKNDHIVCYDISLQ